MKRRKGSIKKAERQLSVSHKSSVERFEMNISESQRRFEILQKEIEENANQLGYEEGADSLHASCDDDCSSEGKGEAKNRLMDDDTDSLDDELLDVMPQRNINLMAKDTFKRTFQRSMSMREQAKINKLKEEEE